MYSRQEIAKQKEAFWTIFGKYMQPVIPADGEKVNWVNYKTGVQGITFRMDADNKQASIAIILSHNYTDIQRRHYAQMLQLKNMLHLATGEDWVWESQLQDGYGKTYCRIGTSITGINILNTEDWPALISFLKPRVIALDEFWSNAKCGFEV